MGANHIQITDIVKDSIAYPFMDWPNFVLLFLLIASCIFIIPIPLFVGYIYRIMTSTIYGYDSLPNFDELAEMYVDGLKLILSLIVYVLFGMMISTIILVIAEVIGGFVGIFFSLINQLFIIILSIFTIFAVSNMVLYNDWIAVFDFKSIYILCNNIGFIRIIAWYGILVLMSIFIIIASIFSLVLPLIPFILLVWFSVFGYRSLALLVACSEDSISFKVDLNETSIEEIEELENNEDDVLDE